MMGDVSNIIQCALEASNRRNSNIETLEAFSIENSNLIVSWISDAIDRFAVTAWAMCNTLLNMMPENRRGSIPADQIVEYKLKLAEKLRATVIDANAPLGRLVTENRFSLKEFVGILQLNPKFSDFQSTLIRKLMDQCETDQSHRLKVAVVFLLISYRYPAFVPDPPVESYTFSVEKEYLQKHFDMELIRPALSRWEKLELHDKVAQRALEELIKAYK
jgi:hypothetical protein